MHVATVFNNVDTSLNRYGTDKNSVGTPKELNSLVEDKLLLNGVAVDDPVLLAQGSYANLNDWWITSPALYDHVIKLKDGVEYRVSYSTLGRLLDHRNFKLIKQTEDIQPLDVKSYSNNNYTGIDLVSDPKNFIRSQSLVQISFDNANMGEGCYFTYWNGSTKMIAKPAGDTSTIYGTTNGTGPGLVRLYCKNGSKASVEVYTSVKTGDVSLQTTKTHITR